MQITDALIGDLVALVHRAGRAILEIYETDFEVQEKADTSPLTQADLGAHAVILAGLNALSPALPVLSEESELPDFATRAGWQDYWLVDPLDGTKEFVSRNGEFTVNIALISDHEPVLGIVGVPVQDKIYVGDVAGRRAWVQPAAGAPTPLRVRPVGDALTIVASRSHGSDRLAAYLDALAEPFASVSRKPVGSSLKLCILAEGGADIYPRLGPTSEWDIGAAHAVLAAAGGDLWAADGTPLTYNRKASFLNPEFIAVADSRYGWRDKAPDVPPGGHQLG